MSVPRPNRRELAAAVCALVVAASANAARPDADPYASMRAQIDAARSLLVSRANDVQARSGLHESLSLRLASDSARLQDASRPEWLTPDDYLRYNALVVQLDASLVDQLVHPKPRDLSSVRGLAEITFQSPADGTTQPLAAYVPAAYSPQSAAPLVVFLHGQQQTESELLAGPWLRQLADASGAIVVAPYARGDVRNYDDRAAQDVYRALELAQSAFNVDKGRVYLAGMSMGAFQVFEIGPKQPHVWAGYLALAGSITDDDKELASKELRGKAVYFVAGGSDPVVPRDYIRGTMAYLRNAGVDAAYYEQPKGEHSIHSLYPAIERAWKDMLAGIRTPASTPAEADTSTGPRARPY